MRLGIHGRWFAISLGALAIAVMVVSSHVAGELRSALEERFSRDLEVRAALLAQRVENGPQTGDWQTVAEDLGRVAQCRVMLVAADGAVRGDSGSARGELARAENLTHRPEIERARELGAVASAPLHSGAHRLFVAAPVRGGAVTFVRLEQTLAPVNAAAARVERMMTLSAMAALALAALVAVIGSRMVSQSIQKLRRSAVAMLDDLSVRTRVRQSDEVGALAEALDRLADHLNRTVEKLGGERDRLAGILET
ncbi:MAG: HAMP domain-containing protein, partial [Polyangiaceae bacterium]